MIQYNGENHEEILKLIGRCTIEIHTEFMYLIFSKTSRLRLYVSDYIEPTKWGGFRIVKGTSL